MSNFRILPPPPPRRRGRKNEKRDLLDQELCHKIGALSAMQVFEVDCSDFRGHYNHIIYACSHYGVDVNKFIGGLSSCCILRLPQQRSDNNTVQLAASPTMLEAYLQLLINPHHFTLVK